MAGSLFKSQNSLGTTKEPFPHLDKKVAGEKSLQYLLCPAYFKKSEENSDEKSKTDVEGFIFSISKLIDILIFFHANIFAGTE